MERKLVKFFDLLAIRPDHHYRQQQFNNAKQIMHKARHRYQQPLHWDARRRVHRTRAVESQRAMYNRVLAETLKLHNQYRARHCASPLTISQRLNQIAQSYAEYLAATSKFEHSGNKLGDEALGENLYMQWISHGPVKVSGTVATKNWYDEIALYDYDNPTYSAETGHFTQMVWKATRKMGVGVALSPDGREVYIVTNYYPAGNIVNAGYFERNVLPPNC